MDKYTREYADEDFDKDQIVTWRCFDLVGDSIVKIDIGGNKGTGFFVKFNLNGDVFYGLATCYHVINSNMINNFISAKIFYLREQQQLINIVLNKNERRIFTYPKPVDVTVIEILPTDQISQALFLDVDNNYEEKERYLDSSILVPQHPLGADLSFSYGHLKKIYSDFEYDFAHCSGTLKGSSGAPIVLVPSLKVIGIHKGKEKDPRKKINYGTFMEYIIKQISKEEEQNNFKNFQIYSEINLPNQGMNNILPNQGNIGMNMGMIPNLNMMPIGNDEEINNYRFFYKGASFDVKGKKNELTETIYKRLEKNIKLSLEDKNNSNIEYLDYKSNEKINLNITLAEAGLGNNFGDFDINVIEKKYDLGYIYINSHLPSDEFTLMLKVNSKELVSSVLKRFEEKTNILPKEKNKIKFLFSNKKITNSDLNLTLEQKGIYDGSSIIIEGDYPENKNILKKYISISRFHKIIFVPKIKIKNCELCELRVQDFYLVSYIIRKFEVINYLGKERLKYILAANKKELKKSDPDTTIFDIGNLSGRDIIEIDIVKK